MTTDYGENNTSLKLVSLVFQGYFSKDEIVNKLGISTAGFYKSLFELRNVGFKLESSRRTYRIKGFHDELKLNEYELSLLAYMINLSWLMFPPEKTASFKNLIRRFMFFADEDDYDIIMQRFSLFRKHSLADEFKEKLDKLGVCFVDNYSLKIILHSGRALFVTPIKLDWEREGLYFCYYNKQKAKEESLNVDRIAKIIIGDEEEYLGQSNEVIFEIYGKLSKSYLLKADERVVDSTKTSLVIASGCEDWDVLFKRLLRYDTLCKVLQPKKAVDAFYAMIELSLANLGADPDPSPNSDDYEQKEYD